MSQKQESEWQCGQEPEVNETPGEELVEPAEAPIDGAEEGAVEEPGEMPEEEEGEAPSDEPDPFQVPDYLKPGSPRESMSVEDPMEETVDGAIEEAGEPEPEEDEATEEPAIEEISFHDIPRKRKHRQKKHYLMRAFMVIGTLILVGLVLLSPLFDVKHIKVEGNLYYTDKQVINMSGAGTGQNIFLDAGSGEIRDRLSSNPYYEEVEVHRELPDTLVISLKERPQVASLKFGEDYVVIDEKGMVLRVTPFLPKLTLLTGLTLSRIEVGAKIDAEEKLSLATTLDMIHTMEKGDLFFKKISIDDLNIQAYIYDMLMVNGRPDNIKRAIEKGDLQKVVNKLYKSKTKRGIITVGDDDYLSFSPEF